MRAEDILDKGRALLKSKGDDYTENRDIDQYQNFDRSNLIASWFKHDQDKSFAVLIGTKLARLASLLNTDKKPNNESILDSFIDGANYFALWGGKRVVTVEDLDRILNPKVAFRCAICGRQACDGNCITNAITTAKPNEPYPARDTNCWFCEQGLGDVNKQPKIIMGKYRQAHIKCYRDANTRSIAEFELP